MDKDKLTRVETQIKELKTHFSSLSDEKHLEELLRIIHRPGWTTPAEYQFVTGILASMVAHVQAVDVLRQTLIASARTVSPQ